MFAFYYYLAIKFIPFLEKIARKENGGRTFVANGVIFAIYRFTKILRCIDS